MRNKLQNYTTMEIYDELGKRLKDSADVMNELAGECNDKEQEIQRLNKVCDTYMKIATKRGNIIEELEKYLENEIRVEMSLDRDMVLRDVFAKLQELKEGIENE